MLGAYFGSTRIVQGAAGLGQDGPLMAYADGVVGGNAASAETPGPLQAYADGSLGAAPLQAFADGVVGGSPENPDMPGSLFAYEDGVLGPHFTGVQYSDSGGGVGPGGGASGGGGGAGGGGEVMADMPAPVLSYQDGVFGGRGCAGLGGPVGPLRAFRDGSLGDDDPGGTPISVYQQGIFDLSDRNANFGPLQAFHDGSLGADAPTSATGATLDLGDEATLTEVKGLLLMLSGTAQQTTEQMMAKLPPDWVTNGIWDTQASQLWQLFVSINPNFKGLEVSQMVGDQVVPNARALAWLVGMMTAPTKDAPGVEWAKKSIPNLYGWYAAGAGPVLAPYLSTADKVKGQRGGAAPAKASMMAWYGLGAAALLGVALVMRGKKTYTANTKRKLRSWRKLGFESQAEYRKAARAARAIGKGFAPR